jgi:multiple sugar transport system permease protein
VIASQALPRRLLSQRQTSTLLRALFMALYVIITVFPFYWMVITTFKTNGDLYNLANNPLWFNEPPTLDHITYLFQRTLFGRWMLNSMIIGFSVVLITLVIATPAGYALARLNLPGAQQLGIAIFATYLVPPSLLFIPLTRVVFGLGLNNTIWSLVVVLPTISIPFATWLLMGYFRGIPPELEEQAMIDGCSRIGAMFRVLLPIASPGVVAAAIFTFTGAWNEFLLALVFINRPALQTVPVKLAGMIVGDQYVWGSIMAGAILASLPVVALYFLAQRFVVSGLAAGAVKG